MLRAAFLAFLAFLAAGSLGAQTTVVPIVTNYDYDSGSLTYLVLGPSVDGSLQGIGNVKTTGSSATTDAAGTATPFVGFTKGFEITVKPGSVAAPLVRAVFTASSTTQVVVDSAWDLSGNGATGWPFSYRTIVGGTGAGDGWFNVSGYSSRTIHFGIEQLSVAAGSVQVQIDCKPAGPAANARPTLVYPAPSGSSQCESASFTVAGATARCSVILPREYGFSQCRFGVKLTDDGGDTGANAEIVWAVFEGSK